MIIILLLILFDILPFSYLVRMYLFDFNDLSFLYKYYKTSTNNFNINKYITFSLSNITITISSTNKFFTSTLCIQPECFLYFCSLPHLWNALSKINLKLVPFKFLNFLEHFILDVHFTSCALVTTVSQLIKLFINVTC